MDYREVKEITPKQAREMLRKKGMEMQQIPLSYCNKEPRILWENFHSEV